MIVTKKYIQRLREKSFLRITEEEEKIILEQLGQEPGEDEDGHMQTFTEQDIWEQIRKIVKDC
jgi:hypothetical protein